MAIHALQVVNTQSTIRALLTPREREILHLIAHEYSTREISQKLFISYDTALTHRKNLLRKLNVRNAAGLVRVDTSICWRPISNTWSFDLVYKKLAVAMLRWQPMPFERGTFRIQNAENRVTMV